MANTNGWNFTTLAAEKTTDTPTVRKDHSENKDAYQPHGKNLAVLFIVFVKLMVLFFVAFSEVGEGATFYKSMAHDRGLGAFSLAAGVAILVIGYVLDMGKSGKNFQIIKFVGVGLLVLCVGGIAASIFKGFPYAPLLMYFLTSVVVCAAVYQLSAKFIKPVPIEVYMYQIGWVSLVTGTGALVVCLIWSGTNNFWWGAATKQEFRDRLRVCNDTVLCTSYQGGVACGAGCKELPEMSACDPLEEHCLAAMLLFSGGYIVSIFNMMVGAALLCVISPSATRNKGRTFISIAAILFSFLWIAASLNGVSTNLANVLVAFSVTGTFILVICKISLMPSGDIMEMKNKVHVYFQSDWVRAGACLILLPLFPVIALLSVLNEGMRRYTVRTHEPVKGRWWTAEMEVIVTYMRDQWTWTSVFRKSVGLLFIYIAIVVGVGKITTLFLAWLNTQLVESGMNLWSTSGVIFAVGIILQFNPVVPGIPIYLACGVIIVPAAELYFGNFYSACTWATFVAMTCKLCGVALVQLTLGSLGRNSKSIRTLVAVNSDPIRVFKLLSWETTNDTSSQPDKASYLSKELTLVLIGGPDWPVAVMAGILNLSVIRMLIGTLPVIVPVATTVIAGGYLSKTGDEFTALAGVFSAISAISFAIMTASFVGMLNDIQTNRSEDLKLIPVDTEVKELDAMNTIKATATEEAVKWQTLPFHAKLVLVLSVLAAWGGTMIAVFAADDCFNDVLLTSDYRDAPINADFGNLIKSPTGTVSVLFLSASLGFYILFQLSILSLYKKVPKP
jgi:hypothetical protein